MDPPAAQGRGPGHGFVKPDTVEQDIDDARHVLAAVEEHGIGLDGIIGKRIVGGVTLFSDAFDKLPAAIEAERRKLTG